MRLASLVLFGLALAAWPAAGDTPGPTTGHPLDGVIVETGSGARLTPEELADRLGRADVAILGEVHDNAEQHRRQAWLIGRLAPAGVAFEMVPEAAEAALAALGPDRRLDRLPKVLDWEGSGWPDFALYRPVFAAAGEARLTGGGVAREQLARAMVEGAAAAHGAGAAEAGLEEPLPPDLQERLEAGMIAAHCDALPAEMAPGMVEAQRLRDARLAAASLRALGDGERAVLVTGNGHARIDHGVPAYLGRLAPGLDVLSLGQVEIEDGAVSVEDYLAEGLPYEFLWFSARTEREDPCAGFAIGSGG